VEALRRRSALIWVLMLAIDARAQAKTLELNTASRAQLESLAGLGPGLVESMLQARAEKPFEGWQDLRQRVRGVGPALALKLSTQGLRVAGQAWNSPAAAALAHSPS